MSKRIVCISLLLALFSGSSTMVRAAESPYASLREKAQDQFRQSNYKDAYNTYREFVFQSNANPRSLPQDFNQSIDCLQRLNRVSETDALRKKMVESHPDNWRVLQAVAQSWQEAKHFGFIVAGEFERGQHRGGGDYASCAKRDRVRALRLMKEAMPLVAKHAQPSEASDFYFVFADIVMGNRGYAEAWRLQYLTDLSELPEVEKIQRWWGFHPGRSSDIGAPVDAEGDPVFYHVPASFETARNDGERWRWLLWKAKEVNPAAKENTQQRLASFFYNQFGVQTMANYGWFFYRPRQPDDTSDDTSGTYELHTLGQDETIARLATGIKRFSLPDEFNFIQYYEDLKDYDQLARIFQNRRQYPRAADYWRRAIKEEGRTDSRQNALDQIVANWGQFEPIATQPAGKGTTVDYKFRNGEKVEFTAHAVKVETLLNDVKEYIESDPVRLNHREINIGRIGYRIVHENQKKYIGREVANWTLDLDPARDHFDKRITVETPLQKAGAYLLTAEMADGNRSDIIVWVNDTAIVKRNLAAEEGSDNQSSDWYFVADAVSGEPVEGANVSFFGYWGERLEKRRGKRYQHIRTVEFAEYSDSEGQVIPDVEDYSSNNRYHPNYIVTARNDDGRFAFMGFTRAWTGRHHDRQYKQTKTYCITDRPVYRPSQTVKFKAWVRHAQYDMPNESRFAGQTFEVVVRNAKNEEIYKKQLKTDKYGGLSGALELPEDAALGQYRWSVSNKGGGSFRVEEYKKPEFEVQVDAPEKPVMLGERITATVQADYYFGEPVKEAKVKIKVTRTEHDARWYPPRPWDWLYGEGYWWFAPNYDWYPGWGAWGIRCPMPFWWHRSAPEPEVVMEREVEIGPDGSVPVEIDTAPAKAMHGDSDHSYSITAEVTDKSRRTIVGNGEVLVARKPFKVYAWVDRGYYRVGDTVHAHVSARTLDGRPVEGDGELRLLRISYDSERQPVETEMQSWDLDTDDRGVADLQMKASKAGQYRLAYTLTDKAGHTIEGAYVFVIRGAGTDANDFRFNAIELVPDKAEYHPGDTLELLVNTKQADSTVVLFVRPSNGVYLMPRILRLDGKSQVVPIEISRQDMPNFYVEAFTVSDGKVHKATRQIVVPPEKRVLNCEIQPSKEEYKPGETANVEVKLTDLDGNPFVGSTVMTIYDRAVEYISGGSNVGGIKDFFWKWRRRHNPRGEDNLSRHTDNVIGKNKTPMRPIGVFGHSVADEVTENLSFGEGVGGMSARGGVARMKGWQATRGAPMAGMAFTDAAPMAMEAKANAGSGGGAVQEPVVRTQFADTAYWNPQLNTDSNGVAEVEFAMPENLTGWKIRLWAMGQGTRVGEATTEVVTKKNLMLRMQAPRFFVQTDEVVLSANIHNYLDDAKLVTAKLELDGNCLEALQPGARVVEVEPGGEARVDWRVKAVEPGTAVVRMKALSDEESDAMQQEYEVYVHGMSRTESFSGAIRPEDTSGSFAFTVPEERRPEQSRLEIRWSPSLAGAMVDALPYLADYPYGCTEQTLSRFLPAVLTRKVLRDMGIDLAAIKEKQTNLNAQEIGDDGERAKQWKRYDRNPVFDEQELDRMVKEGLKRLYNMQLSDGGWGWFSGSGERSSAHTTAYVVHGLQIAKESGLAVVPSVIEEGLNWLERYQKEQVRRIKDEEHWKNHPDNRDAFVFMVLVDADIVNSEMRRLLYADREHLAVYAKAMVGLAMDRLGLDSERDMLVRNIDQYLVQDDENQSAWLNLPNSGYWWHWYGSEYEAQAYYLKLLCRTQPKGRKAAGLVKYLVNNRKHATYWKSTRDTAICVEAMAEYMRASGEVEPDMTVTVLIDGVERKQVRITPQDLFSFDNKLVLEGEDVVSGKHVVKLRKKGRGPLYFNAYQTNFTLEKYIKRAGLEVKVRRNYFKLIESDKEIKVRGDRGQALDQRVDRYEREPVANLNMLKSGDLVEIELVVESKNDYEYIVIEDRKAAGFEPVALRSGYHDNGLRSYAEYRDEKVVFFVQRLARGRHSLSYRMRAEIPGRFSALPAKIEAMYAPELKGNSDEIKLRVED